MSKSSKSIDCRINRRATSAGIAFWSLRNRIPENDITLIDSELDRALHSNEPHSTKLASVLTAEIILRRYGAAL